MLLLLLITVVRIAIAGVIVIPDVQVIRLDVVFRVYNFFLLLLRFRILLCVDIVGSLR